MDNRATADHELLLIRVGHHLWHESRNPREWPQDALLAALETVWTAKEAVRVPLRQEWLLSREKTENHLRQYHYLKGGQ